MKKNEFGENNRAAQNDKGKANVKPMQVGAKSKPAKKFNWNSLVLIVLFAGWLFVSVFFAVKLVKSFSADRDSVPAETVLPTNNLQSPEPSSLVNSPEPTDGVQSPSPSSTAQSPKPTDEAQSPSPSSTAQSPKPTATPTPTSGSNQTSNSGSSTTTANAELIKAIRVKYNYAQSNLANCEVKDFETASKAFFLDGKLVLLREYAKDSADGKFDQHWYYDNGEIYFIFMTEVNTNNEYRLYFNNGTLIRWIDPNGKIYDSSYRWDEMQAFYAHAKAQCDSVSAS
ncbi:MAG: hypothetical protein KBI01_04135 [Oscillospiraceae bacterium]|nr:hypothetical protein [Oscillospiraceae bacterium]